MLRKPCAKKFPTQRYSDHKIQEENTQQWVLQGQEKVLQGQENWVRIKNKRQQVKKNK